jgi:spermidine synthase
MSTSPQEIPGDAVPVPRPAPSASWRLDAMAFATAGVAMFVQVLVHRLVSVKLLNNYAFLVIGLTMLGFALSGVVLSRALPWVLRHRGESILAGSALFAVSLFGSSAAFCHADVTYGLAFRGTSFTGAILRHAPLALPYAIPFAFCGFILGVLLSSPDAPARRVYFSDLVGSALGAFAVIGAISAFGAEAALVGAAGALMLAAIVLFPPRSRAAWLVAACGLAAVVFGAVYRDAIFKMRYPAYSMLADHTSTLEYTAWDPVARIEVSRIPPPNVDTMAYPCLIGGNGKFHSRFRRMLTQNNYAFTYAVDYDGRPESLQGVEETIYASAYAASSVKNPKVLIVGVGGGFDLLTALYYAPRSVVGVEVNAATLHILRDVYRDYFQHWVEDPRITLVHGEGRNYLARSGDHYDVLQLSGVDSYSGTPGAAHVFSESYLYTQEAFDLYLSRLTDDGILNVMRLEFQPPREMFRALVTAVAALRKAGAAEPSRHIMMLTATRLNFTALLVKKTPFTAAEEERLTRWAGTSPYFHVTAAPGRNSARDNAYATYLDLSERDQRSAVATYPFDVSPATDDRPFFFKYSRWAHVVGELPPGNASIPVMEYTLLALLIIIGATAVLCVGVPLLLLHRRGLRTPHAARHAAFFAGIGVGFMAVEMALLQKFGLFLGHPNYALSVVLAALLLFSGVGSLFSATLVRALRGPRFVAYALAGVIFLEYFLALPHLGQWITFPLPARIAVVFALVAPLGLLMGTFFPTVLEQLKESAPDFAPWAWGINGIFSVLAPVLAVAFSTTWGMGALLVAAIPIYLGAAAALPDPSAG